MTLLCEVSAPGDPVPKGRPRSDSRSGRTYTPARTVEAEHAMAWALKIGRVKSGPTVKPVAVTIAFRCQTKRRCDLDNLAKLVLDAGNGIVYVDDQQVVRLAVTVERGVGKRAGTEVRIEEAS